MSNLLPIVNFRTGYNTYEQPEVLPDDGSPLLLDMVPFRGVMIKRDGNQSLIQNPTFSIVDISNANPAEVTTAVPHPYVNGDLVRISGVGGMTEINDPALQPYRVIVTGATTFQLANINSLAFGVYTTGGVVVQLNVLGALAISNVTPGSPAIITTALPHNLTSNQVVFIDGVIGPSGINSLDEPYVVTVTGANTFTVPFNAVPAYVSGGVVYQPIQGFGKRLVATFLKDLIAFNESQAFLFVSGSNTFLNISGTTTWSGDDTIFFWSINYFDSFWATNNFDPIRYYISGTTWTDLRPILNASPFSQSLGPTQVPATAVSWGPFFVQNPAIVPLSVEIVLSGATVNETITDDGAGNLNGTMGSTGTVNYVTGEINITALTPDPTDDRDIIIEYDSGNYRLERALMLFPYKDRLIALSTTEGESFTQFPQRLRYSQNGTPYVESITPPGVPFSGEAWREDIPGRGGFIDAPTDERIVTAGLVRDMLVVLFEFSVWRVRYTGNEVIPFVWERIKSTQGAESTYSGVVFDEGLLSVGRTGTLLSEPNSSRRIDEAIPDQVYQITNLSNAQRRVQGIRDFQRQFVYWTYPEGPDQRFPNRTLVYNYIDRCWALYRQDFTAFGQFQTDTSQTWASNINEWQEETSTWNSGDLTAGFPIVVTGNPIGEVFQIEKDYTVDNGVSFNFSYLTKKYNPFALQGLQCKAVYMFLLLSGTDGGEFTIEHFIDENVDLPIESYVVSTNSNGQEKVWRRVTLNATQAQYHQFRFTFSQEQLDDPIIGAADVEIYQILLDLQPAGRLNYGENL